MAFWDTLFRKQQELSTTVPLNLDVGQASYPDVNYQNFASEGYSKNEIVHACIRELATSAATPRYYVQAPSADGGSVEVETGLLYDLTAKPNPYTDWYSFIERLVTFLMVAGNAYAIKERGRGDQVSVPPAAVGTSARGRGQRRGAVPTAARYRPPLASR